MSLRSSAANRFAAVVNSLAAAAIGIAATAGGLAACSGGSTATPSGSATPTPTASSPRTSTPASSAASSGGSSTQTTAPTTPTGTTGTSSAAHCPKVGSGRATSLPPIACTSVTTLAAAAGKLGLTRYKDTSTIIPGVTLLGFSKTILLPTAKRRSVYIRHTAGGAVVLVNCEGPVATSIDPALAVCADVGSLDPHARATVRAWTLRAGAAIRKSAAALPRLSNSGKAYLACADPSFSTGRDGFAFQIEMVVSNASAPSARHDCAV